MSGPVVTPILGATITSVFVGGWLAMGSLTQTYPNIFGFVTREIFQGQVQPLTEEEKEQTERCFRKIGLENTQGFTIFTNASQIAQEDVMGNNNEAVVYIPKKYFKTAEYPLPLGLPLSSKDDKKEIQHQLRLSSIREGGKLEYFPDELDYRLSFIGTQLYLNFRPRFFAAMGRDLLLSLGIVALPLFDRRIFPKSLQKPINFLAKWPLLIIMGTVTTSFFYRTYQLERESIDHVASRLGRDSIDTALRLAEAERLVDLQQRVGLGKLLITRRGNHLLKHPLVTWRIDHLNRLKEKRMR